MGLHRVYNDAAAWYALLSAANRLATAATQANQAAEAGRLATLSQLSNLKAGQLDRKNLSGRAIPDERAVWRYLSGAGRNPVLTSPK